MKAHSTWAFGGASMKSILEAAEVLFKELGCRSFKTVNFIIEIIIPAGFCEERYVLC